jgi:hypothetical protein
MVIVDHSHELGQHGVMRLSALPLLLLLALTGCANISGLDGITVDRDAGSTADGGSGGDSGGPRDAVADVPADVQPVCLASETDCTDGIDNDCNGKTDCQEPSCTSNGYACTQEVPNGQFGWYSANATPTCPGTSQPTALFTSISGGGGTCACSCTAQTTCPATESVSNEENLQCNVTNNTRVLTLDNACHAAGFDIQVAADSAPLAATKSCTAKGTLPTLTTVAGRICKSQLPKGGGGCAMGMACLPVKPVVPFAACMIVPANTACPSSWPNASTVGTAVMDGRTCSACGCTATGSCSGTASFFTDNACATLKASVALGSCVATGVGATTVGSYKATTTAVAACTNNAATVPVSGSATLSGPLSLCCAN